MSDELPAIEIEGLRYLPSLQHETGLLARGSTLPMRIHDLCTLAQALPHEQIVKVLRAVDHANQRFQFPSLAESYHEAQAALTSERAAHEATKARLASELAGMKAVVEACIAWQEDDGTCHFCGFMARMRRMHDSDCPLVAGDLVLANGKRIGEKQ